MVLEEQRDMCGLRVSLSRSKVPLEPSFLVTCFVRRFQGVEGGWTIYSEKLPYELKHS